MECLLKASKCCSVGKLAVGFGVEAEKCLFLWCRIALLLLHIGDARVPVGCGGVGNLKEEDCGEQVKLGSMAALSGTAVSQTGRSTGARQRHLPCFT